MSWLDVSAGKDGDVAQLVEHLLCKQGVGGSSPLVSTESAGTRRYSARCTSFWEPALVSIWATR